MRWNTFFVWVHNEYTLIRVYIILYVICIYKFIAYSYGISHSPLANWGWVFVPIMRDAPDESARDVRCVALFPSFLPSSVPSFPLLLPTIAVSVALCLPSFPSSLLWNCSWVRLLRAAVGNLVVGTLMAPLQLARSLAAYVLRHCVPPLLLLFLFYKLLLLLLGKS